MKIPEIFEFIRVDERLPHILCPGCGIGSAMNAMVRAIIESGLKNDDVCVVSGIGCSSRIPGYIDADTFHTLHGRAIPSATGVKLAHPELEVIVIAGDGDLLAIGGNHFIHAARRNLDMTVILINNFNYGMTGGQASPTTPQGKYAKTAPYGWTERNFDACAIAQASGAVFVARSTTYHVTHLRTLIKQAIKKKGFALVEVISQCPTLYGRLNRLGDAVKMLEYFRDNTISISQIKDPKEAEGKIVIGVLHDVEAPEYYETYKEIIRRAQAQKHHV
ncbi:MAG: 2-oxoacid:ferredoxin oxidoreductase subunit beta [candidate division WOR-3 bacterium]|nr:2-oxoacid:ferredoxin oxidoreductase subunit beta [candidate division WOR-3 bacterium]